MPQTTGSASAPAAPGESQLATLRVLQERRAMISNQYQTATAERGRIGQERLNAQARGDAAMVKEFDATIERLGTRMKTLEQSLQKADLELDEAMKMPVEINATAVEAPPAPPAPPFLTTELAPPFDPGEMLNAQRHELQRIMALEAGALLLFAALAWRLGVARGKRLAAAVGRTRTDAPRDEDRLQVAVDAIAIEVERLSEGQRFLNNVMTQRRPEREALPVVPRTTTTPNDGTRITPH
jgi:hypothetical protein